MAMEWTSDLEIGVPVIDEQHRLLVDRLNRVSAAMAECQGEEEVGRTLTFLSNYAREHFGDEEALMKREDYPGLERQRVEHASFLDTLAELERDFVEEGSTRPLAEAVDTFLVNWLTRHIQGLDAEFGRYLAARADG